MKLKSAFAFTAVTLCCVMLKAGVCMAKEYVIDQGGEGDFTTISEGVDNAEDGDTLIIHPGIYVEYIEILDKEVNMIGTDRDECVIQYDNNDYFKVPLYVVSGEFRNLTIYGRRKDNQSEDDLTTLQDMKVAGYAVHIDHDHVYGKTIEFSNCKIISENSIPVGIGNRGNSSITFDNCDIIHTNSSGMFIHDSSVDNVGGEAKITITNCTFTNKSGNNFLVLRSYGTQNKTDITIKDISTGKVVLSDGYYDSNLNWDDRKSKMQINLSGQNFFDTITIENMDDGSEEGFLGSNNFILVD